uniref:Shootin-1 n=1 Tax=Angiostrongylus cantonensis TaxID=6313 RepID=A0A158PC42_ANGCA
MLDYSSSQKMAEQARLDKEQAVKECEIAEKEAEECRLQAERMLAITEQLTERNSQLVSEIATEREKNCQLEQKLITTEGSLNRALLKLSERELKLELSSLRKQVDATAPLAPLNSSDSVPSTSSRSRASSLNSIDRITTLSRDDENSHSGQTVSSEPSTIQQVMVDKIIALQKKLVRRNDKIEFLEEHVRCCLEELQKKTRIIQHYALREEAALLLPSNGSLEQVPLARKGTSYSLMGSIFAGGNDKKALQLATEVNSRLQSVLEDALMKNITLKGSLDSLSNEISRLSRENRQLTLAHSRCTEQCP